jgi:hypothetical protein
MVALYRFAPYSFLSILPFVCAIDIPRLIVAHFTHTSTGVGDDLDASQYIVQSFGLMFAGGFIAFFLIILEVQIVQLTSSLTLGVIGQVKEALQIVLAMLIYHDNVTTKGILGIAITLSAAYFYNFLVIRGHKSNGRNSHSSSSGSNGMSPDSRYFRTRKRKPNMSTRKSNRHFKSPLMDRFQLFPIIETANETESTEGDCDGKDDEDEEEDDDDEDDDETEDETARFLSSSDGNTSRNSRMESGEFSTDDNDDNDDVTNNNNNKRKKNNRTIDDDSSNSGIPEDHIELITHHHQEKHITSSSDTMSKSMSTSSNS